ncbi:hypothetical protein [Dactylosporangium matsuzakiense]|nr:hypothetical protein [Dactylosporangium matsuzakiense]UWZ43875.1 hypothetical protein Dmats_41720 [Dactylosporangium matsuzakiense]UWZ43876.1 hypothetical protein Dmats_41725 [Dactylosporangium matsuzakiense]
MAGTSVSTTQDQPPVREGGSHERVTVNLTKKTSDALTEAVRLSRDSKTDTINKALQVYALLQQVEADGGAIYLRENAGAEQERLRVF